MRSIRKLEMKSFFYRKMVWRIRKFTKLTSQDDNDRLIKKRLLHALKKNVGKRQRIIIWSTAELRLWPLIYVHTNTFCRAICVFSAAAMGLRSFVSFLFPHRLLSAIFTKQPFDLIFTDNSNKFKNVLNSIEVNWKPVAQENPEQ